jgi:hypothetical protein
MSLGRRERIRRRRGSALLVVLVLLGVMSVFAMRNGLVLVHLHHTLNDLEARQVRTLDRLAKARYGPQATVRSARPPREKSKEPQMNADERR